MHPAYAHERQVAGSQIEMQTFMASDAMTHAVASTFAVDVVEADPNGVRIPRVLIRVVIVVARQYLEGALIRGRVQRGQVASAADAPVFCGGPRELQRVELEVGWSARTVVVSDVTGCWDVVGGQRSWHRAVGNLYAVCPGCVLEADGLLVPAA